MTGPGRRAEIADLLCPRWAVMRLILANKRIPISGQPPFAQYPYRAIDVFNRG